LPGEEGVGGSERRKPENPAPLPGRSFVVKGGMTDRPPRHRNWRGEKPRSPAEKAHPGQRIAKAMARAGLCSRRDAEGWIAAGRVSVNGQILTSPAFNVTERDEIRVDGAPLVERERTRLFLFHKPRGLLTTAHDPEGRRTIFEALPKELPRLIAIGRLDFNTEGLILLTNDGGLGRVLELPTTGWLRRYRVRAHGEIDQSALDRLSDGVTIDGIAYSGIEARLDRAQGANVWLTMGLREGKNREIKRVLEHLGLTVNRLIRVSFGPFQLGELEEGALVEAPTRVVREQIGPRLAREAHADFDAPLRDRPSSEGSQRNAKRQRPRDRGEFRDPESRRGGAPGPFRVERTKDAPQRHEGRLAKSRKHISAIRADAAETARGPRRRAERSATSDRKGREIKVERLKKVGENVGASEARQNRKGKGKPKPRGRAGGRFERGSPIGAPVGDGRRGPPRGPRGSRRG
jgi:23S rRNA pseudouridine2605 synthase